MVAFLTPHEMFEDWRDELQEMGRKYENEMYLYNLEATKKLGRFALCIAEAYLEGIKSAEEIFDKFDLKDIHAYAIKEDLNHFVVEFDEANERDWDCL